MRTFSLVMTTAMLTFAAIGSRAQCTGTSVFHSSKTEYLTATGEIRKTVDENTTIELNEKSIYVAPGDETPMTLQVKSVSCAWTSAYREGKSTYKASFNEDGMEKIVTVTVENKNDRVYFLVAFDDDAEKRIRVWADSFAEKK